MNRYLAALLTLAVLIFLPACDTSPTEISDGPRVFEGTLGDMEELTFSFVVTRAGGVRIEVTEVTADPPAEDGVRVAIGVGLGRFDDTGDCAVTVSSSLAAGERLAVGLEERTYCLRIFDAGTIPEEETRTFSILVTSAE